MRLQTMLIVVLVVFAALATAKPHYQSKRPQCKVGQSWPAEDGCNTCTCRSDRNGFTCTTRSCHSLEQQLIDHNVLEERIDNNVAAEDDLQPLKALAENNSEHGQWIPFDISGHVFTSWT